MMGVLLPLLAEASTEVGGWRWLGLPPAWLLTLAAIAIFFGLRALYRAERGGAGLPMRLLLAGVRTVVLLLVLLALAGPYREEVKVAEERAHLVVLVDASGSMDTQDRYPPDEAERLRAAAWGNDPAAPTDGNAGTRLDLVRRILAPEGEQLLRELDRRFVLHVFGFASDWWSLGSTKDDRGAQSRAPGAPEADPVAEIGRAVRSLESGGHGQGGTNLGTLLRNVAGEYLGREDRRLAGVLLLTDGRDTGTDESPMEVLSSLGAARSDLHVTPIALGNAASGKNVRMERIRALDVVLVGDDVVYETAIHQRGFTGLAGVRARISIDKVAEADGRPIPPTPYDPGRDQVTEAGPFDPLPAEDGSTPVRLQVRMSQPGTFRVRIRAVLPPKAAAEDAISTDDVAEHEIRVMDQRIKVLLVDNLPRRDFQFLGNWLTREPDDASLGGDVRRRYEAQLFQQSADPTVDQAASPGLRPLRAFPRTRRELFGYDVILLGDVDFGDLRLADSASDRHDILVLLRDFVREGGGLGLIAGQDMHDPLEYRGLPIEDLLPVIPRDRDAHASNDRPREQPFRLELTQIGRNHPIFGIVPGPKGGIATADEVERAWLGDRSYSSEWEWWWLYRALGGLRPGATALALAKPTGPDDQELLDENGRPLVVFATMPYGKGRVFFSAIDGIWRLRYGNGDRYYGPFWDQVIRYLATYRLLGGNVRFKITTDKDTYFVGDTATVTITALDRDYEPVADAFLDGVHVEDPRRQDLVLEGDQRPRNASPEGAAPGTFRMHLPIRREGTWRIWIADTARGTDGGTQSRAERRFEAEYEVPEKRLTIPDHLLLGRIARETGGRLVEGRPARIDELPRVADELPSLTARRVIDRAERPQWDKAWVLLLLIGLLGVEWALRKRGQMI